MALTELRIVGDGLRGLGVGSWGMRDRLEMTGMIRVHDLCIGICGSSFSHEKSNLSWRLRLGSRYCSLAQNGMFFSVSLRLVSHSIFFQDCLALGTLFLLPP